MSYSKWIPSYSHASPAHSSRPFRKALHSESSISLLLEQTRCIFIMTKSCTTTTSQDCILLCNDGDKHWKKADAICALGDAAGSIKWLTQLTLPLREFFPSRWQWQIWPHSVRTLWTFWPIWASESPAMICVNMSFSCSWAWRLVHSSQDSSSRSRPASPQALIAPVFLPWNEKKTFRPTKRKRPGQNCQCQN